MRLREQLEEGHNWQPQLASTACRMNSPTPKSEITGQRRARRIRYAALIRISAQEPTACRTPGRQVTSLHLPPAGRYPVQIVLLRLASPTCVALRAHLAQPQLSQHLVDLGELVRRDRDARARAPRCSSRATTGRLAPSLTWAALNRLNTTSPVTCSTGSERIRRTCSRTSRRRPCPFVLGAAARPRGAHHSEPPKSSSGWATMLTAPPPQAAPPISRL